MLIKEFMTKDVFTCQANQTVEVVAKEMVDHGVSVMPIVDESKKLVGIITQSDFIGKEANIPHALASIKKLFGELLYFGDVEPIYEKAKKRNIEEVMTKDPIRLTSEDSLTTIVKLMSEKNLKRIPIVDGDQLVGIVTRKDLIKAFVNS